MLTSADMEQIFWPPAECASDDEDGCSHETDDEAVLATTQDRIQGEP